ncbi:hypothetical protein B0H11DRAFT_2269927 [Mycena galericulata]|nr:hypothetical protein B0H11DRAFT_2269927 [Mycena galericulata]
MNNAENNVLDAPAQLAAAEKLLKAYKKKKSTVKAKFDKSNPGYRKNLEERMSRCNLLVAQSTMNPNAPTLEGSPNDPPPGGAGSGQLVQQPQVTGEQIRKPSPVVPIDPALADGPPAKRPREERPRHWKIVDPIDTMADSISARMLKELRSADPAAMLDDFPHLSALGRDAEIIMDKVLEVASEFKFEHAKLKWELEYEYETSAAVIDVLQLHTWLITANLVVALPEVKEEKPAAAKKGECFISVRDPLLNQNRGQSKILRK